MSKFEELLSSWETTTVISSFFCVNSLISLSTSAYKTKEKVKKWDNSRIKADWTTGKNSVLPVWLKEVCRNNLKFNEENETFNYNWLNTCSFSSFCKISLSFSLPPFNCIWVLFNWSNSIYGKKNTNHSGINQWVSQSVFCLFSSFDDH